MSRFSEFLGGPPDDRDSYMGRPEPTAVVVKSKAEKRHDMLKKLAPDLHKLLESTHKIVGCYDDYFDKKMDDQLDAGLIRDNKALWSNPKIRVLVGKARKEFQMEATETANPLYAIFNAIKIESKELQSLKNAVDNALGKGGVAGDVKELPTHIQKLASALKALTHRKATAVIDDLLPAWKEAFKALPIIEKNPVLASMARKESHTARLSRNVSEGRAPSF